MLELEKEVPLSGSDEAEALAGGFRSFGGEGLEFRFDKLPAGGVIG